MLPDYITETGLTGYGGIGGEKHGQSCIVFMPHRRYALHDHENLYSALSMLYKFSVQGQCRTDISGKLQALYPEPMSSVAGAFTTEQK